MSVGCSNLGKGRLAGSGQLGAHSDSAGELAPLLEHPERPRRARHQEAVAARDQALDVLRVRMWVAARHVVVLADLENAIDRLGHHRMLILARVAELLAEIPFPDQHHADARNLLEHPWEILDPAGVLALEDREDLALRGQRPDVGARVVVLLREAPVARGARRRVAADAGRLVAWRVGQTRVAAGAHRGTPLLDPADG